jgi:hypothetical protein
LDAGGVAEQSPTTSRGIVLAGSVGFERLVTKGRVPQAGGETKQCLLSLCRVLAGIASVRRRGDRLRCRRKREAEERDCDEKRWSCFELNQWVHRIFSFCFPAVLILSLQVRKRRRTWRGKSSHLIQIGFSDTEFDKNLATLSNQFAVSTNRRFKFNKRSQLLLSVHNEALSVVAMRVCNPDCSAFTIQS